MSNNYFLGIIKFFRDPNKLNALENGLFYCNTPEYYRFSSDEGISDLHESCTTAYRSSRGDLPIKIKIKGQEIEGLTAVTIYQGGTKDRWLHCWFGLHIPQNESELNFLANDLNRMRKEFGVNFAFIPCDKIAAFVNHLETLSTYKVDHGFVRYSDSKMDWSYGCKPSAYSYQREYRFVIGECNHTCVEHLELNSDLGFSNFILINQSIEIVDADAGHVFFHLDVESCYSNIAAS